jgi:hypothetical protein
MRIEVTLALPFYLRLEGPTAVTYEAVCRDSLVPELIGCAVVVTFSRHSVGAIDYSGFTASRSIATIAVETNGPVPEDSRHIFAIRNCQEIINSFIVAYHAVTGEVSNAGYICPLSTDDIQLFAEILVDGQDIRDRWPFHDANTFPLTAEQAAEVSGYVARHDGLPLAKVFLTNARLLLEQGQYAPSVVQAATAVEVRTSEYVRAKLKAAGWTDQAIMPYENLTLGGKLAKKKPDPLSLETYLDGVAGFDQIYASAKGELKDLRNDVMHRGRLPTSDEAVRVLEIAANFLHVVV